MNLNRISKLSELVTNKNKRKPTIVVDSKDNNTFSVFGSTSGININVDTDRWSISEELKLFIEELCKDSNDSIEEKILKIYEKLCEEYTYDDNVLSYIRKNDDDTFFLPDEYGRDTDSSWKAKRQQHTRRTCFEISRILAKSISELLKISGYSKKYDVCILWDEAVTHYFVGLACDDYYISMDLDDFTQIKDLTRMKTGLTLEGIVVLEDNNNKFNSVLRRFNSNRGKIAKTFIEDKYKSEEKKKNEFNSEIFSDDIEFIKYTIQILREEYDLDSTGMFEYIKEIVDTRIGARSRKKYWKEVESNLGVGTRYTRCLVITIDDISYIIDVTKKDPTEILRRADEEEMSQLKPFNIQRKWKFDPYDGR